MAFCLSRFVLLLLLLKLPSISVNQSTVGIDFYIYSAEWYTFGASIAITSTFVHASYIRTIIKHAQPTHTQTYRTYAQNDHTSRNVNIMELMRNDRH